MKQSNLVLKKSQFQIQDSSVDKNHRTRKTDSYISKMKTKSSLIYKPTEQVENLQTGIQIDLIDGNDLDNQFTYQKQDYESSKKRYSSRPNINTEELKGIQVQAAQILKNIENHIHMCQTLRATSHQSNNFSFKDSQNFQKQLESPQFTPNRDNDDFISQPKNQKEINIININSTTRNMMVKTQVVSKKVRPMSSQPQQKEFRRQHSPIIQNCPTPNQNLIKKTEIKTIPTIATLKEEIQNLFDTDVQMSQFKLDQILGRGAYAQVRLSTMKQSKDKYAIKIYEKSKLGDSQKLQNVKREISLLKEIDHNSIIKLHYALEDKRTINLVMEFISPQSLATFAKQKNSRQIPIPEALRIFKCLSQAIQYLHQRNIAHRDIKMENVLLSTDASQVKLIDFGFAIKVREGRKLNVFCGTPSYMSPQIVSKTPHCPFTSDVWSLGILLSTLITGTHPFKGSNDRDLYRAIQCAKWKPPQNFDVPEEVSKLINGCLQKEVESRWTVDRILSEPIMA